MAGAILDYKYTLWEQVFTHKNTWYKRLFTGQKLASTWVHMLSYNLHKLGLSLIGFKVDLN